MQKYPKITGRDLTVGDLTVGGMATNGVGDLIRVLYPEDALAPVGRGIEVVEQRCSRASQVQQARGAGSEPHSNTHPAHVHYAYTLG